MNKKTACLGLCMILTSSIILADNPFGDNKLETEESTSYKSNNNANVKVSKEQETQKDNSNSSENKTSQYTVVKGDYLY